MRYLTVLEKAGCKVIAFKTFGSYQGTWLAFVEYDNEKGIVEGAYGSCSLCDSFEATFGRYDTPSEENGKYYSSPYAGEDYEISKERYDEIIKSIDNELIKFGKSYLVGGLYSKKHYQNKLANLREDEWFDEEKKEECQWAISRDW